MPYLNTTSGRFKPGAWRAGSEGGASLAPLTSRIVFAGNSYGAQTGNIDLVQYALNRAGSRGEITLGTRQSRGGDRLTHLIDRWSAVDACKPAVVVVMNTENDLADAAVTNDAAGGNVLLSRIDSVLTLARASGVSKIIIEKQTNTTTALGGKVNAVTQYHAGLATRAAAASDIVLTDPSVVDLTNAAHSTDGVHPNKTVSARLYGEMLGDLIAACFVSAGMFDASGQLAGNIHTNWNMGSAGTLTNASGASASQTSGFLRTMPSVPCRIVAISGTATADPTSTGDIQLRFASPHAGGTDTIGKSMTCIAVVEITDAAGNNPVGMATFQIQAAQSTAFGKTYVTTHGGWTTKMQGAVVVPPSLITAQSLTCNIDFIVRALAGAVDIELRIGLVNVLYTDTVAYGPVVNASQIFTSGRPVLFSAPTSTPASGPLAVGGTLGVGSTYARFLGGGLTRTYDAIRDGTTDVGDAFPQTAASAAIPYTIVAGDSTHTLAIRSNASNSYGGGSSANVSTTAISVT